MTDFAKLRDDYAQYKKDISNQSFDEYDDRVHDNQSRLHSLIKNMEKNVPNKTSLEDSMMMFEAYRYLHEDYRDEEDLPKWLGHAKKIVSDCPEKQSDGLLGEIIRALPDMTTSPAELFNVSCKAVKKISSKDLSLPMYYKDVEKHADKLFDYLMSAGRVAKTDEEKSKHFEKAFKMTIFLTPTRRVSAHRDTIAALTPIYNQSEHGKIEIGHKQKVGFNRVWKSLPTSIKNAYKQRSFNCYK